MSKNKDNLESRLAAIVEAATSSDFPDTLSTADLVGQTFTIHSVELKSWDTPTPGEGHVADISSDSLGDVQAWLTGTVLRPLLEEIVSDGLPATVLLTRREDLFGNPYVLSSVA